MEQETDSPPASDKVSAPATEEPNPSAPGADHQEDSPNISDVIETAKTRALEFLSTASNEALGACLVGLGAATYIVLGRVGLVLIGVVGGVALHASWEHSSHGEEESVARKIDLNRRRETGLEVVRRILDWRQKSMATAAETGGDEAASVQSSGFSTFRPATAIALDTLSNAIIQDYVKWWYSPIIPTDLSFPSACRQTLEAFIVSFSSNLSRKRPADTFLDFITNSSSIMIVFLNELSAALSASSNHSASEAIHTYLEEKPESHMANILDSSQQQRKLHVVADDILERFLDANVYRCSPARIFLREVLANVVLEKTLQSCCKSEWINEWIIYLLEEGEPELMNVIDNGIDGSAVQQAVGDSQQPFKRVDSFEVTEDGIVVDTGGDAIERSLHEVIQPAQLTVDEDCWKGRKRHGINTTDDDGSDSTHGIETPSSQDEKDAEEEAFASRLNVTMIDAAPSSPSFINFDQLAPSQHSSSRSGLTPDRQARPTMLTLHKASISIFDDSEPGDNRTLRSKPDIDYLIQIEPASSQFAGWMIARTYEDFENLHEILRRISAISGVGFTSSHANLPHWRGSTQAQLHDKLERYIVDAVAYETLAESEGMKRFLEKERGFTKSPSDKGSFWPNATAFENMGKGMLDVLTKAPKGVAGSGRAVFGGVTSVITGSGFNSPSPLSRSTTSMDSRRGSLLFNGDGSLETSRRPSVASSSPKQSNDIRRSSSSSRRGALSRQASSVDLSRLRIASADVSVRATPIQRRMPRPATPAMELPPPPSDVDDDYLSPAMTSWPATPRNEVSTPQMSIDETSLADLRTPWSRPPSPVPTLSTDDRKSTESLRPTRKTYSPLSEQETQVTVELLFAVINELYTLSSAWNIRRTLLTAAKTFLVRTGNPQLESIRVLLQQSVLDANTSDEGLARHILKLRENSLPTEEELKGWPRPPSNEQNEARMKKARRLLMERGMPQALTSVMGGAASGEALGKVFDSLQIEEVAKGLMFGLMLQAVRALVQ